MATKRKFTGWRRQSVDPRDQFRIVSRRTIARMPMSYDLSGSMGSYLDQEDEGSCGPNTEAELLMYNRLRQGLSGSVPSRLHLYWWTRFLMGTTSYDSGVDNRSMFKAASQYGYVPDESLWPYLDSQEFVQPPDSVNAIGLQNLIAGYSAVVQNLNQMQGTIVNGEPFCLGFDVFSQIESDQAAQTGIIADPTGQSIGGHDMSCCGYNATSGSLPGVKTGNIWPAGTFKLRQHWTNADGSKWGDGGYGYMSFGYATGPNASDFWLVNSVPGGNPSPVPTPSPIPAPGPTPSPVPVPTPTPVPVPTPTPIPTPTPPVPPAIKALVDSLFVQMEHVYAKWPQIKNILLALQQKVDAVLTASLASNPANRNLNRVQMPIWLKGIMQSACDAAIVAWPQYTKEFSDLKVLLNTLLARA